VNIKIKYTHCWTSEKKNYTMKRGPLRHAHWSLLVPTKLKVRPGAQGAKRRRWCWRTAPLIRNGSPLLGELASSSHCGFTFSFVLARGLSSWMFDSYTRLWDSWPRVGIRGTGREPERTRLCNQLNFQGEFPRNAKAFRCNLTLSQPQKVSFSWRLLFS
jgi:hypothetical protein